MGERKYTSKDGIKCVKVNFFMPESDYDLMKDLIQKGITAAANPSEFIRKAIHNEITDEMKRQELIKKLKSEVLS